MAIDEFGDHHFCSEAEVRSYFDNKHDLARREAQAIGPELLSILAFVVTERFTNVAPRYCLSVFGAAPDKDLQARLREAGHDPMACPPKQQSPKTRGDYQYGSGPFFFGVDKVRRVQSDRFEVVTGYYCGLLCGGEDRLLVIRDPSKGLKVESSQMITRQ